MLSLNDEIRNMYLQGKSASKIVKELTLKGVKSAKGKPLTTKIVHNILARVVPDRSERKAAKTKQPNIVEIKEITNSNSGVIVVFSKDASIIKTILNELEW